VTTPPPAKRWHTREDSGIRLDRALRWWHDGEQIEHPKIIEAFNLGLQPTDDGRFRLEFGKDWCFVEVEDAAYAVVAVDVTDDEQLSVRLSDRTAERLSLETLRSEPDGVLACSVKKGRAKARFSRDAQFAFGALLEAGSSGGPVQLRVGSRLLPLPVQDLAL
jgi:uncharacterized protein